jgi:hypothetical protein
MDTEGEELGIRGRCRVRAGSLSCKLDLRLPILHKRHYQFTVQHEHKAILGWLSFTQLVSWGVRPAAQQMRPFSSFRLDFGTPIALSTFRREPCTFTALP